jgi:hypothetical protein
VQRSGDKHYPSFWIAVPLACLSEALETSQGESVVSENNNSWQRSHANHRWLGMDATPLVLVLAPLASRKSQGKREARC